MAKKSAAKEHRFGECLVCKNWRRLTRGLCSTHHGLYLKHRAELSKDEAKAFDAESIAAGVLLPSVRGQKKSNKVVDPFAALADKAKHDLNAALMQDSAKHAKAGK